MSDAEKVAAVGVRFLAVYAIFQAVAGLVGVVGVARMNTGLAAVGLGAAVLVLVIGVALWVGASAVGSVIARGID